jgi:hypothetical protein
MKQLHRNNQTPFLKINRTGLGAIALASMALILPACGDEEVGENVTTEDVIERTDEVIGQEVTIRNEVGQQIDDFAFTMIDDEFFGGEEVLVINASGEPTVLPEDIPLQVTGEVVQFVLADVEAEYGLDLDDELYVDYEDQSAIIANSIALSPTAETVLEEPDVFYAAETVAVQGDVENVYSPSAFVLHDEEVVDDDGLLVISVTPEPILESDAAGTEDYTEVVVTGEVRPFVIADIERDYDYDWAGFDQVTLDEIEAEFANKPVVIARQIYPSANE